MSQNGFPGNDDSWGHSGFEEEEKLQKQKVKKSKSSRMSSGSRVQPAENVVDSNMESNGACCKPKEKDSSEKKKSRSKRPDIQVYVPRGRRSVETSNGAKGDSAKPDETTNEAETSHSRGRRSSDSRGKSSSDPDNDNARDESPHTGGSAERGAASDPRNRRARPDMPVYIPRAKRMQLHMANADNENNENIMRQMEAAEATAAARAENDAPEDEPTPEVERSDRSPPRSQSHVTSSTPTKAKRRRNSGNKHREKKRQELDKSETGSDDFDLVPMVTDISQVETDSEKGADNIKLEEDHIILAYGPLLPPGFEASGGSPIKSEPEEQIAYGPPLPPEFLVPAPPAPLGPPLQTQEQDPAVLACGSPIDPIIMTQGPVILNTSDTSFYEDAIDTSFEVGNTSFEVRNTSVEVNSTSDIDGSQVKSGPSHDSVPIINGENDQTIKNEMRIKNETQMDIGIETRELKNTVLRDDNQNIEMYHDCESDEDADSDDWEAMFNDNGDCLDPKLIEELTQAVGEVKVQKPPKNKYLDFTPKDPDLDMDEYTHLIEIADFSPDLVTRDLLTIFQDYMKKGFDVKWVDDTHCIGIFSSKIAARDAAKLTHPMITVRPISHASRQTKLKAKRCAEFLQPYKPRPETTASTARRLVTHSLGLAPRISKEKRELERQQLKEAKEKKKMASRQKDDIWEGKCAMDDA